MAQLIFRTVELEKNITDAQYAELKLIEENQNTTDKDAPGSYRFYLDEGNYQITIDDDYNVIVEGLLESWDQEAI